MKLFLNHLGYEPQSSKRAVIHAGADFASTTFRVVRLEDHETVLEGEIRNGGRVNGWRDWHFFTLDFSALTTEGEYYLQVNTDQAPRRHDPTISAPFRVCAGILRDTTLSDNLDYFKTQRCSGQFDLKDRSASFVGGRKGTADVHGGWYDASGDTSKYLSHLSYANFLNPQQTPIVVWSLANAAISLASCTKDLSRNLARRARDEAAHGGDFLVRMLDPEGYFYMTVFDKWTKELEQRVICSYATQSGHKYETYQAGLRQGGGFAIAALAKLAQAGISGEYSTRDYLDAAIRGFDHIIVHNTSYLDDGEENIIDDYCGLAAAVELYKATQEWRFLEQARYRAQRLVGRQTSDEHFNGWFLAGSDKERPYFHAAEAGLPAITLMSYIEVEFDAQYKQPAQAAVQKALEFELDITRRVNNPFGYARQYIKPLDGKRRDAFFFPHVNESGYWWQGENARLASLAAAAKLGAELFAANTEFASKLKDFAQDQLDWILGKNPFDMCMLHGHGRNNPIYEIGFPQSCGGICNGITSGFLDENDIDFAPASVAGRGDQIWRWGEQWIPHAAWYVFAITR